MKAKKLLLIVMVAAVIGIGWILVARAASGTELLERQQKLLEEADTLVDRKLYVRAIPFYKEALEQESSLTPEIQEGLLRAYQEYEDMASYAELVKKRAAAGNAGEEEYLLAAEYYMGVSEREEAITLLREGLQKLENGSRVKEYLEEIRYEYKVRLTHYQQILPAKDNQMMPAFNGEKWGYVDANGSEVLPCIYDSATAFGSEGYAVVKINGTYYSILKNGDWYGADDGTNYERMTDVLMVSSSRILGKRSGTYSYFDSDFSPIAKEYQFSRMTGNANGVAAVEKEGKWGIITDSGKTVVDFTLEDVAVNSLGSAFAGERAMVKEGGRWYLIDTQGQHIGEASYAEAKAPESKGYIAVANEEGKWGYIDRDGKQVIDFSYMDAKSFSQQLGAVQTVNEWGYISEENKMVIEPIYGNLEPFHNGIAQVETSEGAGLITLKFFEE